MRDKLYLLLLQVYLKPYFLILTALLLQTLSFTGRVSLSSGRMRKML